MSLNTSANDEPRCVLPRQVQVAWADATFQLKAHKEKKDVVLLSDVDDLTTCVDDSVVTMGNVLASPHVGPIRSEAEEFGGKLTLLQVMPTFIMGGRRIGFLSERRVRANKVHR